MFVLLNNELDLISHTDNAGNDQSNEMKRTGKFKIVVDVEGSSMAAHGAEFVTYLKRWKLYSYRRNSGSSRSF